MKLFVIGICIFIFIFNINSIIEDKALEYFKKALNYENNNDFDQAAKYYYESYKINKNEKILLKTARISIDIDDSIDKYNEFLNTYPASRFRLLARYELANLYLINNYNDKALNEFVKLLKSGKGTIYWEKSILKIGYLYYVKDDYKNSIDNLLLGLKYTEDYETQGNINYLLGRIFLKQTDFKKAEHYFLITAGSYSECSKGAASFLELLNIYIINQNYAKANKAYTILSEMYSDSLEKKEADSIIEKNKEKFKDVKNEDLNLVNINNNNFINVNNKRLNDDLELSLNIDIYDKENIKIDNHDDNSDFYIQLAYLSTEENAKKIKSDYEKKGIKDVFYSKTKSSASDKILYRILIGPFDTKEKASIILIELKEQNIEAIILELSKEYE